MTAGFWWFLAGGVTTVFVSTVFFAVKYNKLYFESTRHKAEVFRLQQIVHDLEQRVDPQQWNDDPQHTIRVREQMYDKYDDLLKPGTEVIRIDTLDDIPPLLTYTKPELTPIQSETADRIEKSFLSGDDDWHAVEPVPPPGWRKRVGDE